ncbi:recombinase family protein [Shimia sp. R9_3]|uniref:recombinase family protein n=1 Tax=Shimia sp. R9_3 TaxID=2821113 RepID=UPI001ADC2094|nr:recombinase family protein [Shimia sp. R9_3]MBO9401425.1 recombinase family protein [Shimia sp. R9_3]
MSIWPHIATTGRLIGYARVSTKDQRLRMQLDALNGVNCDLIYKDHGVSGAKASRSGLDAMLAELHEGDTVVVFKLDRLGRSVLHLADLLVRFQNEGIHFCSISEGINTTTPGGKLVFHLFSAFAEFQRDIIAENTRAGLDAARKRGAKLGRPPAIDIGVVLEAHRTIQQEGLTISGAARLLEVDRSTLSRHLNNTRTLSF